MTGAFRSAVHIKKLGVCEIADAFLLHENKEKAPQNGAVLLVMAFLISPMGLPLAAGKGAEFEICDPGLGVWVNDVNIIWNEKKQDNGR